MPHSRVKILVDKLESLEPIKGKILFISRQNEKGVQVLKNKYAGIDDSSSHTGYIAFSEDEDVSYSALEKRQNSKGDIYNQTVSLKLIVWHKEPCGLKLSKYLIAQMNSVARDFEFIPDSISTNSEAIFREETGKEEGEDIKVDINLIQINFKISYRERLAACKTYEEEGCDGC